MDPSNPFGAMMQQAVKMKGASQATLRTIFDGWPKYYQNSMFAKEDIVAARAADFDERLAAANAKKSQGNELVKQRNYFDAQMEYEKALSVFKYCENLNPNWRNQVRRGRARCNLAKRSCWCRESRTRIFALWTRQAPHQKRKRQSGSSKSLAC